MRRIVTILLSIAAFAALGAGGAASASAAEFVADQYPFTIKGEAAPGQQANFKVLGQEMKCVPPSFSSSESQPTADFESDSTNDGTCYPVGAERPLKTNGCQLYFKLGSQLDLRCPEGKVMTTEILNGCNVELQYEGTGSILSYENLGEGVRVSGYIGFQTIWPKNCGGGIGHADYYPVWDLTAVDGEGNPTGLSVGTAPHFDAESYPATLSGVGTVGFRNESDGGKVTCPSTNLSGSLSQSSNDLAIAPSQTTCTYVSPSKVEFPTIMKSEGCALATHALNTVPYSAAVDVDCSNPALQAIKFNIYLSQKALEKGEIYCTSEVKEQLLKNPLALANVGTGKERGIDLEGEHSKVEYTGSCGSGAVGALSVDVTLKGKTGGGAQNGVYVSG